MSVDERHIFTDILISDSMIGGGKTKKGRTCKRNKIKNKRKNNTRR